jgi:hypothetical protein
MNKTQHRPYLVDSTLTDTISCLQWSYSDRFIAASTWDNKVNKIQF